MTPNGFNLVTTWGFWVLGLGILLMVALIWCHDVNRKLNFILAAAVLIFFVLPLWVINR